MYMTVVKLAIGVTGVVGNLLVVIVILRYKKLFQQVKSNIINQSVIDCLVSVMLIQTAIIRTTGTPEALLGNSLFCKLVTSQLLLWAMVDSSTLNLMAISIQCRIKYGSQRLEQMQWWLSSGCLAFSIRVLTSSQHLEYSEEGAWWCSSGNRGFSQLCSDYCKCSSL